MYIELRTQTTKCIIDPSLAESQETRSVVAARNDHFGSWLQQLTVWMSCFQSCKPKLDVTNTELTQLFRDSRIGYHIAQRPLAANAECPVFGEITYCEGKAILDRP
jgi:hypothetical protein